MPSPHCASLHAGYTPERGCLARAPKTPMYYTPLIVELLRSQPRLAFWAATLAQGALWWVVPSLFYSSPPGELPLVLAVGHEFQLGSSFGPPLAFWMAEIAFRIAGAPGVYLLAQGCVVIAYYGVFTLARAIVGMHHATFAVLLMVGIFAFTAPTPDFGPAVLAMPFTVFALVNLWRAVAERRRAGWFLLALQLGLLMLTTYAGLILVFAIFMFLAATRRGRRALRSAEPWLASIVVVAVLFPHLIWLDLATERLPLELSLPRASGPHPSNLLGFMELLTLEHAGLIILVALGSKWPFRAQEKAPVFARSFTDPFGRRFVYFFALVPALAAALLASFSAERETPGSLAPYLVLSGLAVVVWGGNSIHWHRPRIAATAWSLMLAAPPLGVAAGILVLPWLGVAGTGVDPPLSWAVFSQKASSVAPALRSRSWRESRAPPRWWRLARRRGQVSILMRRQSARRGRRQMTSAARGWSWCGPMTIPARRRPPISRCASPGSWRTCRAPSSARYRGVCRCCGSVGASFALRRMRPRGRPMRRRTNKRARMLAGLFSLHCFPFTAVGTQNL
jgi:Dolichyl-phosphate-mannose-protein mannosyltransferase